MGTEEKSQPAMKELVGRQLKQARERAGLSTADVAAAQHLRPAVIQAIEEGDYSQIDSELFLKGYVRAYAKQVRLDADAVIADLDQELEPIRQRRAQEQEANPLVDIERRRRRKRQFAKTLFFLVVLGIAGYLAVTFLVPKQEAEAVSPDTGAASDQTQSETNEDSSPELRESGSVASEEAQGIAAGDSEQVITQQPELPGEPVETDAAEQESAVQSAEVEASTESSEPALEQIPAVVQTPEPVLENPNGLSEVSDAGRLEIRFSDDCWVQISDATGNRLVNSLQRDGDQIDVSGPAPLRVVIGAVNAVESIRFQGEPVDIDGYRVVNNRSEFSLTI